MLGVLVCAQERPAAAKFDTRHRPRLEDFLVVENWIPPAAPLKLPLRSERMFQTQLVNAAKERPNFAGHYRFTYWGCGSFCSAAALVDLQTGDVFPPPLA